MKVQKIHLASLQNEEHFQFITDVKNLLEKASEAVKTALGDSIAQFSSVHGREDASLEQMRKNEHTLSLADLDARRDSMYRGLALLVEAYSHSLEDVDVKAAARIQAVLDHYGNFTQASYVKETATIYNLAQDLTNRCEEDIETINAGRFLRNLSFANREFQELMDKRHDDNAANQVENLRDLRLEADALYRKIVSIIDASIIISGETNFADFVNKLNERVAYYNNMLAIRKGVAAAKKEKAE
ncbi:MAG: DUF6261 family protein [Bacteroidales bacterium]|jgi:DNA-binding transcriptional MerR regulator|nr:DUF6261 family protein [Bacteroidales bacterium]